MAKKKKKFKKIDNRTKEQKIQDYLKMQRKISREMQLQSGVVLKSHTFKDKTKYDRKSRKKDDRKEIKDNS